MKKEAHAIPRAARWVMSHLVREEVREELLGDLEEVFAVRVEDRSRWYAIAMCWVEVGHLLIGFYGMQLRSHPSSATMRRHYAMVTIRHMTRNKSYALVNLFGLAIALSVSLVIFQYVHFERSFDQFHADHKHIYRVIVDEQYGASWESDPNGLGYDFGPEAVATVPGIEAIVRKQHVNRTAAVTSAQSVYYEPVNTLFFVDASFFEVFDFPLLRGAAGEVFEHDYSILLTASAAERYFGTEDPIGQRLSINGPPSPGDYTVTGVVSDPPLNTHWQFDFLMPIDNYIEQGWGGAVRRNGGWWGFKVVTYVELEPTADAQEVTQRLNKLVADHLSEGATTDKKVWLQRVSDIHLRSGGLVYPGQFDDVGDEPTLWVLLVVALVVMLIAWINYANLATAQSLRRTREVGIRKSMGAHRDQLVSQFLAEALLYNLLAGGVAIALGSALMPALSDLIGKQISIDLLNPLLWMFVFVLIAVGTALSGLYPAFVLSRLQPMLALQGERRSNRRMGLQQGLTIVQFVISLLLLSATYLVYQQTSFMKNQSLGIDLEQVLIVEGPRVTPDRQRSVADFRVFRNELSADPNIAAVTGSLFGPGQFWTGLYRRPGTPKNEAPYSRGFYTTLHFDEVYDLRIIAGEPFRPYMPDEKVVVINESALEAFGFESAEGAVGQNLISEDAQRPEKIVGVVEDFHWHTLHEGHKPYVLSLYEDRLTENISIKLSTNDLSETMALIEEAFRSTFPGNPFDYRFADDDFNRRYQSEEQFSKIFLVFTLLAIFIACIGLFAMVSHSFNLRVKEIGIRKVLGADLRELVVLLSRSYLLTILLSALIVVPIVWFFGRRWLEGFAYRIPLGLDLFLLPSALLLLLASFTIARRTWVTAMANPVDSLRKE